MAQRVGQQGTVDSLFIGLVFNIVSLGSCIALTIMICSVRKSRRHLRSQDIFTKLFLSLAVADALFHFGLGGTSFTSLWFILHSPNPDSATKACTILYTVFEPARLVSVLHEVNISAYCLCIAFHYRKVLIILRKTVIIFWIFGIGLGVVITRMNVWDYDPQWGACVNKQKDHISDVFILGAGAFCLSSYAFVVMKYSCGSARVTRNQLIRLSLYPLNFVLTYGLVMTAYIVSPLYHGKVYMIAAGWSESLNGFLNMAVYYGQSRYVCKVLDRDLRNRSDGNVAAILNVAAPGHGTPNQETQSNSSGHSRSRTQHMEPLLDEHIFMERAVLGTWHEEDDQHQFSLPPVTSYTIEGPS